MARPVQDARATLAIPRIDSGLCPYLLHHRVAIGGRVPLRCGHSAGRFGRHDGLPDGGGVPCTVCRTRHGYRDRTNATDNASARAAHRRPVGRCDRAFRGNQLRDRHRRDPDHLLGFRRPVGRLGPGVGAGDCASSESQPGPESDIRGTSQSPPAHHAGAPQTDRDAGLAGSSVSIRFHGNLPAGDAGFRLYQQPGTPEQRQRNLC